jgi:hypothetical protein
MSEAESVATCKRCTVCAEEKPLDAFHQSRGMKDGHLNQCKECVRAYKRAWNKRNRASLNAAQKRFRERNPDAKRYYERHPDKKREHRQAWAADHPEKIKAHSAVQRAVRAGTLVKPNECERCTRSFDPHLLHGHHEDYSKRLEVEWLCAYCHNQLHEEARKSTATRIEEEAGK